MAELLTKQIIRSFVKKRLANSESIAIAIAIAYLDRLWTTLS
ncbi:hypothetical protein [Pantoea sp. R13S299]